MKKPKILVVGSTNMDLVVKTKKAPRAGETLIGESFFQAPGGKGANQAVACARLESEVIFITKLGEDYFGEQLLDHLSNEGIITSYVLRNGSSTGFANIILDEEGQNQIIVIPGANIEISKKELAFLEKNIGKYDIVVMQFEIPVEIVEYVADLAYSNNVPVLLNPAPAKIISDDLLSKLSYITPNETEIESLTGLSVNDFDSAKKAADVLLKKDVKNVIITMGKDGAVFVNKDQAFMLPVQPSKVVDTVAAGDSFTAAFAVSVTKGMNYKNALAFANKVASITVSKYGAQPSLPTLKEVE